MNSAANLLATAASAACLCTGGVLAAESPPANETPDFSEGFQQLIELGLPEIGDSPRWVKHPPSTRQINYQLRELVGKMAGTGWVIPPAGEDGKAAVLPMGGLEPVELPSSQIPKSDADLKKDVKTLITALREDPDAMENLFGRGMSSISNYQGPNSGNLLLFAAQLHQAGETALANRLAVTVMGMAPDAGNVVDSAVSQIASTAYQRVITAFFANPDFAALHSAIQDLNQRFPRGWREGRALAMLMPQLAKQAGGEPLPEPRLEGVELDPAALAAVAAWQKPPEKPDRPRHPSMSGYGFIHHGMQVPSLWLLGGDDEDQSGTPAGPHAEIIKRGMNAIPVLAALAEDAGLTVLPNQNMGSHVYYSSRESEEQLILGIYQRMQRPATRGEIARQLLAATLPDPDDQMNEADAASIRIAAMDFWKQHRGKSRDELLLVFLQQGSRSQASHVAALLASSTAPESHAAFEKHLLAAENPLDFIQPATVYLGQRRAEGKSFFDAFAARVREHAELAGDDIEQSWEVRQAGGIDKLLKTMKSLASPESPRAMARNIARGEPDDAPSAIQALATLIEKDEPAKQLEIFIAGANTATDPALRCHFIAATFRLDWSEGREIPEDESEDEEEEAMPPPRAISGTETILWRKLTADTREVPENLRGRYDLGDSPSIGKLAATAFEYSVSPHEAHTLRQLAPVLGKPLADYLHDRATARLTGDPVPPVPDAARVSDERLKEIVAQAADLPVAEIPGHLGQLSPDERAKWLEWFADPGDPPLPEKFLQAKKHLLARSTQSFYGIADHPGVLGLDVGFVLDSKSLQHHLESLTGNLSAHSPAFAAIQKSALGPGLEILSHRMEPPAGDEHEEDAVAGEPNPQQNVMTSMFQRHAQTLADQPDVQAVIVATASTGDGGKSSTWWVRAGKLVRPEGEGDNDHWGIEEDPEEFNNLIDDFLPSAESKTFHLRIECLAREHAAIFNPNNE